MMLHLGFFFYFDTFWREQAQYTNQYTNRVLQMVPAPPNTTAAHTDSQPQRDNRDIMRVGCDTKWVSEAAIAAGHRVGSRGNPRAAPHAGRVAARLYPTPGAPARATTRRESRQIHALSHVQ